VGAVGSRVNIYVQEIVPKEFEELFGRLEERCELCSLRHAARTYHRAICLCYPVTRANFAEKIA
jgi:hypothetical protein